jgi:hypothetical protein
MFANVFLQKILGDVPEFQEQLNLREKQKAMDTAETSCDESEHEEINHYG